MNGRGRPIRFLFLVIGGWTGARFGLLWSQVGLTGAVHRLVPVAAAPREIVAAAPLAVRHPVVPAFRSVPAPPMFRLTGPMAELPAPHAVMVAVLGALAVQPVEQAQGAALIVPVSRQAPPFLPSRWSGSAWLLMRGRSGLSSGFGGGQLGGAQGGMRIGYAVDAGRHWAIAARFSNPIFSAGREASLGVEWRPAALPIRLIAERRFAIDGGAGGTAIGLVGGSGPAPIGHGIALETYGQAGAIARHGVEGFVEGAARLSHPAAEIGGLRLDLGLGAWGGAQRDASRLDLGPSLTFAIPLANRRLRAALDWRQRIAGRAHPGSGLALTLGTDF